MSMTDLPTLYRIRAGGVLRVGTTGDYTPFSLRRADGSYEGADIDMAHDLAGTIGVVTFVTAYVPFVGFIGPVVFGLAFIRYLLGALQELRASAIIPSQADL